MSGFRVLELLESEYCRHELKRLCNTSCVQSEALCVNRSAVCSSVVDVEFEVLDDTTIHHE